MEHDPGTLELVLGAVVAALFLVAIVWVPLYAVVLRAERSARERDAVELARPVDVTNDAARAEYGRLFEQDMAELTRMVGERRAELPPSREYPSMPRLPGLPFMMDPLSPAGLPSFGLHAMDRAGLGGEIAV